MRVLHNYMMYKPSTVNMRHKPRFLTYNQNIHDTPKGAHLKLTVVGNHLLSDKR